MQEALCKQALFRKPWHMRTGDLPSYVESVRLVPAGDTASAKPQPPMPGASPLSPQPGEASGAAELDVNLEYTCGCWRSHAARLTLPVTPTFRCRALACCVQC